MTKMNRKQFIGELNERGDFLWNFSAEVPEMLLCLGNRRYIALAMWRTSAGWNEVGGICAWDGRLDNPTLKQSVHFPDWGEKFTIENGEIVE